jgi:hypothetical protein
VGWIEKRLSAVHRQRRIGDTRSDEMTARFVAHAMGVILLIGLHTPMLDEGRHHDE